MNNTRRKIIQGLQEKLEEIKNDLDCLVEEESEAFENLPEGIQAGERGDRAQEVIDALENAVASFEEIEEQLNEAGA